MDNKAKLKKYKLDEDGLRKILNEWDFIGVLPFQGGPQDEYDCLINPILAILSKNNEVENLNEYLQKELVEHFGYPPYPEEKIKIITERIIKWWKSK